MSDWDFKNRELEAGIEDQVVAWAENHGWEVRKIKYIGRRGAPDRHFYGYGRVVMIEFKRPGEPLRADQKREHERLASVGIEVFVHRTTEGAIKTLKGFM